MIVFEEVKPHHRWIIKLYRFCKKEVYFLRLSRKVKRMSWTKQAISDKILQKIDFLNIFSTFDGSYPDRAYDNINCFYRYFYDNKVIAGIKKLYTKNIDLAFKKVLLNNLSRFYFINYFMQRLDFAYPDRRILFIPSDGIDLHRTDGCEIYDYFKFCKWQRITGSGRISTSNVKFPVWAIAGSYICAFKRKASTFIKIFSFLFWVRINKIINIFKKPLCDNNYKYAFMIVAPPRQFSNNIQKVDYLIDDILIKKNESIFISGNKLEKKCTKYLTDNNLNYVDDLDAFISEKAINNAMSPCLSLLLSFREEDFVLDTGLKLIYYYLKWESFISRNKIDSLVTYADFSIQSIARNIILEEHGGESYYYMDSANFGYSFCKHDLDNRYRHNLFGFLYYDYFISWCDEASRYFEESYCRFKNYINLGCLWAEHLRLIQEGEIKSDFKDVLCSRGYKENMKLIAVFDSTFHDASLTPHTDGINFLKGILRLLDDLPDLFMVLKEKKPRSRHQKFTDRFKEILDVYARLENHTRCCCLNSGESSSEIIAFSDLTISFPFTSTTFESLSARRKGIWYAASDKFRGTFYDHVPGLVCHSYEDLLTRVKSLLSEISEKEYNDYLDKHIEGKIELYLDGKAITRFRNLLKDKCRVDGFKPDRVTFAGEKVD